MRRTVVQKLHQLECNGFDIWSYMKKGDNIFVYHSANRAGPPSSTDLIEEKPTTLGCNANSFEASEKNDTSEMFQNKTEDSVAGSANNSLPSLRCAPATVKNCIPVSLIHGMGTPT
ncbi:hypothetical protein M0657_010037 [Pyricularia oryzae]|uniref:Uncharacterized protein n=1 Tax=Pyricularia grisea TaxID=148305 RepID=A0A6P8BK98_PYRGI|nr:uncharacterized protein PgNI_01057 [Pyricularia grisea]KAI7913422.1 hypothetical protein M0657_010037 [Pyricularia oryzae]TLD17321.1 hypothetical protein PgNI_01057 [Pyricularia grisea]